MNLKLALKNDKAELEQLQRSIETFLLEHHLSEELVSDLSLLAEEVLVNIIEHGYNGQKEGGKDIYVDLSLDNNHTVSLKIRDSAPPFNPLSAKERDPKDERIGGWGIPMLRKLSDQVEYERQGNENILTIIRGERDS